MITGNKTRKINIAIVLFFLTLGSLSAAEGTATRRFGLFIGSNNGGRERIMLRYAVSDARSVSRVFAAMGGITAEDNIILVEPTVAEINRQLDNFVRISGQARRNSQRTELVFYYSGHSDEDGIFLNRERYGYRELRDRINTVQSEMKIVILDSCSSGAITRAKGGVKTQPFLFDTSVSAAGYAFLTSSSDDETSQESDSIESSYFTHSLLAGLRGAADSVGDGRVTLNELYRYAYTETLAKTETSMYGPQHPSYDIQISGSGDVVLTDIKEISANLVIAENITGRISIRDSSDFLVAELSKVTNKPLVLGLEPGLYRVTLQQGNNFYRAEINLPENKQTGLGMSDFSMIAAATGDRRRGEDPETDVDSEADNDEVRYHPFSFQFLPGFDGTWQSRQKATNSFLLGLTVGISHNLRGLGTAPIGLIHSGDVWGVQASGVFNIANGSLNGMQAAGVFNILNGSRNGLQAAGVFNINNESGSGVQAAGIFNNTNGDVRGLQTAGIFSNANGNVQGLQVSGIYNNANGNLMGTQAAGILNITSGEVTGLQAAGIFNKAVTINGIQAAGLVNINEGGRGAMVGIVNISESEDIIPFGIVNIMKNGILHPAIYMDDMLLTNISFRSGTKYFYTFVSVGTRGGYFLGGGDAILATRGGFGFEIPIKKFFINIDLSSGYLINLSTVINDSSSLWNNDTVKIGPLTFDGDNPASVTSMTQLRFIFGYEIFEHLGVFAGLSYDYLYRSHGTNPDPRDFEGPFLGGVFGRHTHKMGFFGGIQF